MKISGRTFIISGGASGLGRACARDICSLGGHAAILDMNSEQGSALQHHLGRDSGGRLGDPKRQAAGRGDPSRRGWGCPGWCWTGTCSRWGWRQVDFVLGVNLRGRWIWCGRCCRILGRGPGEGPDGERGVVVMVSSAAAFEGQMGQVAYAASKGAVAAMTLPMARDLARFGIRVVTIAPSMFESNMTAHMSEKVRVGLKKAMEFPARPGQPEEFASLVRQAIENVMLNGVVIRLDGATRMPSKL
ncbi:hypothetical protein CHGG_01966 [Chaetomium globosum CBS 148.51]|uniref:3-hydroxyacyl-CoA dehydrogenase type-2 n=1 Tax=Chaetomium globosum (strain ATCC 6205 / CBS 148.51 / DSM 1962 / NBRC 6347 / NRRL 1970) TaxID=306901 RepID=Q2HCT8_CHAGB|nr:uncharacterized protein CHGG_01966 [Chaetomium globosum CBS 148.51]EAQ93731.1 hypothetical protein CHGG_01966 [Chaetomium globosum CBS 148.51]